MLRDYFVQVSVNKAPLEEEPSQNVRRRLNTLCCKSHRGQLAGPLMVCLNRELNPPGERNRRQLPFDKRFRCSRIAKGQTSLFNGEDD